MNSTDGYFDVTANRTKIVTVPDGYEVRLHKINDIENNFPDGINTKDIKDLDGTLAIDLSTPSTIDLKGTLLSDGQPIPTMDEIDTEIEEKITALNLSGTYATITSLNTVKATADAAAPQSTTYTKTECDNKFTQIAWVNSQIDAKIAEQNIPTTYATITSLNAVKATADAAAPQSTTYTKTECDNKYATKTEVTAIKTTADAAAPQATTYTKTECDGKFALLTTTYTKTESDNKYATKTEVTAIKTTADAAAPQSTTYTKTEVDASLNSKANSADVYTKTESDNKYALKTDQSITSTSDKVQICNTSQQVANASAITVVNGGLIFQTDGKVFIGVNGAWVQLGVPIS